MFGAVISSEEDGFAKVDGFPKDWSSNHCIGKILCESAILSMTCSHQTKYNRSEFNRNSHMRTRFEWWTELDNCIHRLTSCVSMAGHITSLWL